MQYHKQLKKELVMRTKHNMYQINGRLATCEIISSTQRTEKFESIGNILSRLSRLNHNYPYDKEGESNLIFNRAEHVLPTILDCVTGISAQPLLMSESKNLAYRELCDDVPDNCYHDHNIV